MSDDFSRRYFLKVLAAGAATSSGVLAACSSGADGKAEPVGDIKAGNISALAEGQVNAVPGSPVYWT